MAIYTEKHYNAIFILAGSLVKEGEMWRTCNFNEGDNFGVLGDTVRVLAGSLLFKNGATNHIIALGGKGQYKDTPNFPDISSVIKKELIQLDIPSDHIEVNLSDGTSAQLITIKEMASQRRWKKVGIVSNRYHLPRIGSMIEHFSKIKDLKTTADLISAEEVLINYDPERWQDEIKRAYEKDGMKNRIAMEQKSIKDLKEGKYKLS